MTVSVPKAFAWIGMILAGAAIVIFAFGGGSGSHYYVYARFKDAGGLLPKFFVKVDQVQAGLVQSVKLNKAENVVTVKMELDHGAYPIGQGATAAVRPVNLLGEKYVQLTTGNLNKPLKSGAVIPESRTSIPVELDDVFNTLDPQTRDGLGIIINEAGLSLAGQGTNFMQTLRELPPTLSGAKQVVGEIASENTSLEQAIVDGNSVLKTINGKKANLQNLIASGQDALTAINTARTQLGSTLDSAPGGLTQLRVSLSNLQQAAQSLTPAAANLERATPSLALTLKRLPAFSKDAGEALKEANAVAPAIDRLGKQSAPILKQIRPAANSVSTFTGKVQPLLTTLDSGGGLKELLSFMQNWASVTSTRDGLGHVFRLRISIGADLLTSALQRYGSLLGVKSGGTTSAAKPKSKQPASSPASQPTSTPAGTPSKPSLGSTLSGILGQAGSNLSNTLSGVTSGLGSTVSKLLHPSAPASAPSSTGNGLSNLLNSVTGK